MIMGGGVSYLYVHYYKRIYLDLIDETYDKLKVRFASNPILSTMREDEQIIKNFGYTKFADSEDEDPEDLDARDMGI